MSNIFKQMQAAIVSKADEIVTGHKASMDAEQAAHVSNVSVDTTTWAGFYADHGADLAAFNASEASYETADEAKIAAAEADLKTLVDSDDSTVKSILDGQNAVDAFEAANNVTMTAYFTQETADFNAYKTWRGDISEFNANIA